MTSVLVVDDRPLNRQFVTTLLGYRNYQVFEASDGAEALKIVQTNKPDLIIADIVMPTMDGYEFVRKLREDDAFRDVPVIFYTATYREKEAHLVAESCGVQYVLTKPAEPAEILRTVDLALGTVTPHESIAMPVVWPAKDLGLLTDALEETLLESKRTVSRLAALTELSLTLSETLDLPTLLKIFLRSARDIVASRYAAVAVFNPAHNEFQHFQVSGFDKGTKFTVHDDITKGTLAPLLSQPSPLRLYDSDNQITPFEFLDPTIKAKSLLAAPLIQKEQLAGWICFIDKIGEQQFTNEDERLAITLAAQFAAAYKNAGLHKEMEDWAAQLQQEILERNRAEQQLKKLSSAVEQTADSVVITNFNGVIEYVNPAFETLTGYTREEAIGKTPRMLKSNFHDKNFYRDLWQTILSGNVFRCQITNRRKNGEILYEEQTITPIRNQDGVISHFIATGKDITAQRQVQEALRHSEERFRLAFEEGPIGMALVGKDRKFITINKAQYEMLGYTQQEMMGLNFEDITYREDVDSSLQFANRLFSGDLQSYRMEKRYIKKNRDLIWVLLMVSIIRDAAGDPAYAFAMVENIHNRKQAEERLKIQHAATKVLANSVELDEVAEGILETLCRNLSGDFAALWTIDKVTKTMRCTASWREDAFFEAFDHQCKARSLLPGEGLPGIVWMTGEPLWRSSFPNDPQFIRSADAAAAGLRKGFAFPVNSGKLTIGVIEILGREMLEPEPGLVQMLISIGLQIGAFIERKESEASKRELEKQLQQSQKIEAIGQLAGGVAHDFNNTLMAISGYCELMLMQLPERDPHRLIVINVLKSAEQGANLTQQLLAFSRRQILVPVLLDLNETIKKIQHMLQRLIGENIELITFFAKDLHQIKADPGQVEQILINLAVNSRDAMPNGGKLLIETTNTTLDEIYASNHVDVNPGKYVMLTVTDNGTGMNEETLTHIFEPFFTTKDEGKGTGLGLSTVYGIAKQSGAHISVYSQEGIGTTFKVYLPSMGMQELPERGQTPAAPLTVSGNGETILVVDDNDSIRNALTSFLIYKGYKTIEAGNSQAALELVTSYAGKIDLLITDVIMPGMSGYDLAAKIKQLQPGILILYMSGYTEEAIQKQGRLEPGSDFLSKPAPMNQLLARIRQMIDSR